MLRKRAAEGAPSPPYRTRRATPGPEEVESRRRRRGNSGEERKEEWERGSRERSGEGKGERSHESL